MKIDKIIGVVDESPYDARTWSGSSRYFFNALENTGVLGMAVAAQPAKVIRRIFQILSFQFGMREWKFKYHLNTHYYHQMTATAKKALDQIDPSSYNVILQIGAWYDLTGYKDKKVVSYHDGNLATLLASPYGYPKINETVINKSLQWEQKLYNKLDLLFPMSRWLADSFIRDFGVDHRKIFPVGAGVNLPQVQEIKQKNYDEPRILFVGKDFKRKGGEDLLKAFEIVRGEIPNAELTVVGPELASPPKGVRCIGFVSKTTSEGMEVLLQEYRRASIFVLPSLYEPFGIAFAEAMAHKLPCIGTKICAMPEIIEDGEMGYVVSPGDSVALADKMITLLKEPTLCSAFGEAGYGRYTEKFTWSAVTSQICEIISSQL
ncbi:glycosyltransferase family 4 protein [Geomonas agri]|uniref:glycosyltransferase family 4 protein n=1 Tax=Geomonas agri TaxID=2873702 RepID=UPI001CD2C786|nr:glycosyltransferase family 4 protein [Geomonas agri]